MHLYSGSAFLGEAGEPCKIVIRLGEFLFQGNVSDRTVGSQRGAGFSLWAHGRDRYAMAAEGKMRKFGKTGVETCSSSLVKEWSFRHPSAGLPGAVRYCSNVGREFDVITQERS
jgi:hypothetical protein